MCGIVGYLGKQNALAVVISGLERLEYRGYDSAGVAVAEEGEVVVRRACGKLRELKKILQDYRPVHEPRLAIGHTRWATHGRPSEDNAHPHTAGRVSLIHNGIIENYIELREELEREGRVFRSETDTEIAAHLLDRELNNGTAPLMALRRACERIRGSYAFLALDSQNPDRILVAKSATPIVIGVGEDEMIVASDIPAVLPVTRRVVILEDGDLAEVRLGVVNIENNGEIVERPIHAISWDPVTAQKGGYKHYMLKEIHEQVMVLGEAFRGRLKLEEKRVFLPEVNLTDSEINEISRIVLVACGTAWHACLVAKFYIEELAGIPCDVDYASEYRYRHALYDRHTLAIAVSQSGETADTLAAFESLIGTAKTLAVCNVVGSSLARKVQGTIFQQAGPEISVASTKAFTTQLVAVYLLALYLGRRRGSLGPDAVAGFMEDLVRLPSAVDEALKMEGAVKKAARQFHTARDFLFLGRGLCYPIALEGALKLKEISYIHAEGYPAGEMKHGPIALIDEHMPVVVCLQHSPEIFDKTLTNLREVESRGGQIFAITDTEGHEELHKIAERVIEVPYISKFMSPIVMTIPLQLLAYHVAVFNGTDVDLPRNLAKSVTVE